MPQAPDFFAQADFRFVTNYFLAGCSGSKFLVIDLNSEAQLGLLALLFIPDPEDIVQDVFDPSGGRGGRPNRRGRKRPKRGFPWGPQTLISRPLRSVANPFNAFRLSPLRYAFPILNAYEAVNFSVAVVESLGDVLYERALAVLTVDQSECVDLARMQRSDQPQRIYQSQFGNPTQLVLPDLDFQVGFSSVPQGCSLAEEYALSYVADIANVNLPPFDIKLQIRGSGGTVYAESFEATVGTGDVVSLQVDATVPAAESAGWWAVKPAGGFFWVRNAGALAFGIQNWPWPFNK